MKSIRPTPWLSALALALALGLGAGAASTPALLFARTGPPVALEAAPPPAAAPAEVHPHHAPSLWRPAGSEARRPPVRVRPRRWHPERPESAARMASPAPAPRRDG